MPVAMRAGLVLGNDELTRKPAAIGALAREAEALGFDSLWVIERERFPVTRQPTCDVHAGSVPVASTLDCKLDVLAVAALNTDRVRLGISLPNVPFYSPLSVARSLAALDRVAAGRLALGLGLGATFAEARGVVAALARPTSPASEFLRAFEAAWTADERGFAGEHYVIPGATLDDAPRHAPLPIALTAFAPAAVEGAAALLGEVPIAAQPHASLARERGLRELAADVRRSAGRMGIAVRAAVRVTDAPLGGDRALFTGSAEQVRADLAAAKALGATEILFDLSADPGARDLPIALGRLRELLPLLTGARARAAA